MFSRRLLNCKSSEAQVTSILILLLIQLSLVGPTLGQNYHVTYDKSGTEINRSPLDVYCYQFTWVGPIEEDYNKTKSCEQVELNDAIPGSPCFEPLVWTIGPNRMNGPDLEELERLCREEGNSDGRPCFPFCRKDDGDSCVTMTYTQRDVYKTIRYQSHFCGRGVDPSNQFKALEDSCHVQYSRDDFDVSACFCQTHKCNGSPWNVSPLSYSYMQVIAALVLFRPWVQVDGVF
ncbi:hypothetical protein TCAL_05416, partial [Tigriopus californicus]|eukprot:TCALIF_05416-PA protein Name:"Protein of unknown function" AED:0.26 eAED:0.26 QI:0/1/0/1/1/0.5/2/0/232